MQQPDNYQNNRDHQQDMEQATECVGADEPQQPEDRQDHYDGPQHFFGINYYLK